MNKKVGIERCSSYEPEELYTSLKKAVDCAGGLDVAGKTVLLKPNIVFDTPPEKAVCTHPAFLKAAIRLVREMGAKRILAGDSPGLQTPGFMARNSGLGEMAIKCGAEWVDFTKEKTEVPCPDGRVMKKFTITKAAEDADIIISLPKLKTHQLVYFTGALKNLFGLVPSMAKSAFHVRFSDLRSFSAMIVDLNLALKPTYAFMDAVTGMEGPGPGSGDPRHIGLVLASSNLLAMDVAASVIIGYPPDRIPVNSDALNRKFWLSDFSEIEYPCLIPQELKIPDYKKIPIKASSGQFLHFLLPQPIKKLLHSFDPMPAILPDICVRCGNCVRICASQALSINERVTIDKRRCIRCFCCHEICPVKAIEIKK